ncbi:hypothetical protein PV327_011317, partial [Microctonus hyperodae]
MFHCRLRMSSGSAAKKCVSCGIFSNKVPGSKKIVESESEAEIFSDFFDVACTVGSYLCRKCYTRYSFDSKSTSEVKCESQEVKSSQESSDTPSAFSQSSGSVFECNVKEGKEIEYVSLPFKRTIVTHRKCFICGKISGTVLVPFEARKQGQRNQLSVEESNESRKENSLAVEVDSKRLNRRKVLFRRLTSGEILDFPELTEEDLK